MKKDMNRALRATLRAEETATDTRFERAEALLTRRAAEQPAKTLRPTPEHDRVMRDSFTIPNVEYDRIGQVRERCLRAGVSATKSEILRAGLAALAGMTDDELIANVEALPKVKTGRPVNVA